VGGHIGGSERLGHDFWVMRRAGSGLKCAVQWLRVMIWYRYCSRWTIYEGGGEVKETEDNRMGLSEGFQGQTWVTPAFTGLVLRGAEVEDGEARVSSIARTAIGPLSLPT
jgi:hypothetical protein